MTSPLTKKNTRHTSYPPLVFVTLIVLRGVSLRKGSEESEVHFGSPQVGKSRASEVRAVPQILLPVFVSQVRCVKRTSAAPVQLCYCKCSMRSSLKSNTQKKRKYTTRITLPQLQLGNRNLTRARYTSSSKLATGSKYSEYPSAASTRKSQLPRTSLIRDRATSAQCNVHFADPARQSRLRTASPVREIHLRRPSSKIAASKCKSNTHSPLPQLQLKNGFLQIFACNQPRSTQAIHAHILTVTHVTL